MNESLLRDFHDAQIDDYIRKKVVPIVDTYNDWCKMVKDFVDAQMSERKPQTLIHKLDISSWRVLLALLSLIIMCFSSCIYAYNLRCENQILRVNDLKYRYIRMVGNIDDTTVYNLDELLYKDRSGSVLNEIEDQVNDY